LRSGTAPAPTTPALAAKRPVFHSEADFQHAFAWEIHQHLPDAYVRLEYRPALLPTRAYVDVWVVDGNQTLAIELKYKTAPLSVQLDDGEKFDLMSQGHRTSGATISSAICGDWNKYYSLPKRFDIGSAADERVEVLATGNAVNIRRSVSLPRGASG